MDDFNLIKDRVVAELLKGDVTVYRDVDKPLGDDDRVRSIIARMEEDGSFGDIDYTDLTREAGFPHRNHTIDLVQLAKAYRTESS